MIIRNFSITKNNGTKLIDDLNFFIGDGDKIALIGEEGNGKSTLMKALYDRTLVDDYVKIEGEVIKENDDIIAYLPQHLDEKWYDCLPYEFLLKKEPSDSIDMEKYNKLKTFSKIMDEIHMDKSLIDSDTLMGKLSGGERVKIQLIKLMANPFTILFLDEPTNDLDQETLEFLEDYIVNLKAKVLFISHDETLLRKTANRILHIEQPNMKTKQKNTFFKGNYKTYIENRESNYEKEIRISKKEKAEFLEKKRKLNDIMNAVHYAQNAVSRGDPSTGRLLKKKMHNLKSMERRFNEESYSKYDYNEEAINVFFEPTSIDENKRVIDFHIDALKIEDKTLINDIDLLVYGKDKVVITGNNGTGKSLLLKKIYEENKDRRDIKIGYMPQDYMHFLKNYNSPVDFLLTVGDKDDVSYSRQLLGAMKFTREEMLHNTNNLSDGQKAKLYILKLIKSKCDVLLLDEPTRNFSPLSSPVIREIINNFDGCVIAISHDRLFINEVFEKVYSIKNQSFTLLD